MENKNTPNSNDEAREIYNDILRDNGRPYPEESPTSKTEGEEISNEVIRRGYMKERFEDKWPVKEYFRNSIEYFSRTGRIDANLANTLHDLMVDYAKRVNSSLYAKINALEVEKEEMFTIEQIKQAIKLAQETEYDADSGWILCYDEEEVLEELANLKNQKEEKG